jgi:DNA polymerase
MIKVTADFETIARANLKKTGAYEYSKDPATFASCFAMKANNAPAIYFLDYYKMRTPWKDLPKKFQDLWTSWILDPDVVFTAHNAFFEQCIYYNVLVARFGWPNISPRKWRCTAAKAAAVAIPRNLADAGAVMQTSIQKDFEGHRVMMKLCKPTAAYTKWKKQWDKFTDRGQEELADNMVDNGIPDEFYTPETAPEDFEKLYKYCKIDVLAEEKLDASLPDLNDFEQELWFLDQKINWRGTQVDMPVVNKISEVMAKESKTMGKELDVLTMGLVSSGNARVQILEFLKLEEIELPNLQAKTVDDFLKNGKVTGDAKKLLEIRRALSKASTAKYQKFQLCAASDGRVRDLFLYHGASTGRWGGKNVQPQNFPRGVIKDIDEAISRIKSESVDDLKLLYGENLMPLFSSVLRGMFIATPGHELFVEDLNAIETRVLWWLADHKEGLEIFYSGRDPYREMAARIFNKSILEVTEEERQVGKAAVLGCGYQMGAKKFQSSAWDVYRAKVSLDLAKVAVSAYRELHYPVTELWENYNNACIFAVENPGRRYRVGKIKFFSEKGFLWIELPSGRRIAYKDPSVVMARTMVMINEETEDTIYASTPEVYKDAIAKGYKKKSEFQSKRLKYFAVNHKAKKIDCVIPKWTREASYGGKICENIVQAVSRDVLAEAIMRGEQKGFSVLMHSHDEMVAEAPKGKFKIELDQKGNWYSPDYRAILEAAPTWGEGLPLKAAGWVGTRYKKG